MSNTAAPTRTLNLFDSVSVIIGIILGVGIYETTPTIAASLPNSGWFYGMWVLGGLLSLAGALCYAELASMYPDEGGDYVYLREAFGRGVAFLFGWSRLLVIRPGSIAAMAFPFATYFSQLFPVFDSEVEQLALAVISVVGLTLVNLWSVRAGAKTQNFLSTVKVLGLILICSVILFSPAVSNTAASQSAHEVNFGLALILVLFCYGGWSEIAFVAGEVKNPTRTILKALLAGLGVMTLLFILVSFSFATALGFEGVAASKAIGADVMEQILPKFGGPAISLLIAISALGAINGLIFTGARISYAIASESKLLSWLALWDKNTLTPKRALLTQALISVIIILLAKSFISVVVYTTAVVWMFYFLTGVSIFILRRKAPEKERPYRAHLYPITPIVFCLSCVYLTYSALLYDINGSLIAIAIVMTGVVVYTLEKRMDA